MARVLSGMEVRTYGGTVDVEASIHPFANRVVLTVSDGCGECGTTSVVHLLPSQAEVLLHILEEVKATVSLGVGDNQVTMTTDSSKGTTLSLQDGTITVEIPSHCEFSLRKALFKAVEATMEHDEQKVE